MKFAVLLQWFNSENPKNTICLEVRIQMPVYTYRREDGTTFDIQQKFLDEPLSVDPTTGQKVVRVIQAPGIIFKGSGFYVNDSKSSSKTTVSNKSSNGNGSSNGGTTSDTKAESGTKTESSDAKSEKSSEAKPSESKSSESTTTKSIAAD
jgi:predicted nucleic acid-binding Zn ribbon protein